MVGVHGNCNLDSTWLKRVKSTQIQQLFSQVQLCVDIDSRPGKERNAAGKLIGCELVCAKQVHMSIHLWHSLPADYVFYPKVTERSL